MRRTERHVRSRRNGLVHVTAHGHQTLCGRPVRLEAGDEPLPTCLPCLRAAQRRGGVIYLIHFEEPYAHAQHYMGWTQDLAIRLICHRMGRGARLMDVVTQAGIEWGVAAVFYGDRDEERRMKNHGHGRRCPRCRSTTRSAA